MNFDIVASLFARIEQETSRTVITELLADLFRQANAEESEFLAYFSLGQLYPSYRNRNLNLSTKSVGKAFARMLGRDPKEVAAQVKEAGDVGLFIRQALLEQRGRIVDEPTDVTVMEVCDELHAIVETTGTGSQDAKEEKLIALLHRASAEAACYIARSVVGKLRLGFSDMTLLDAYSWLMRGDKTLRPQLEHAYNVCADIGGVIRMAKEEGTEALHHAQITPGIPVRPAAAERLADAHAVVAKLGACVAQPKLDGFRVQIHVWTDEQGDRQVRFFSRNLHDMSEMFPDLTALVRDLPATNLVMEGEAIVHHPKTGQFLPFQETVKRKRKHGVDDAAEQLPLTLYLFDLLYVNNHSLLATGHDSRRHQMEELCKDVTSDKLQVIEEREINTGDELALYFDEAMSHGLEGLVIKKPRAHYQPGKRNFNWIKLKRQERGELADTIDCVVLGYYKGAGKRAQFGIGALLVGIFNPNNDKFETIAKIGTGLTDDQWKQEKRRCDAIAVVEQPHNVICAEGLKPDVWVNPELVCMIRADDISKSPIHTAGKTDHHPGYALRFPRIMGWRPDKEATQTNTPQEIARLYELQDLKVR